MTVVEAHLGASSTESLAAAEASNAEFKKLVTEADPSIDALLTGHTHLPSNFDAPVPGDPDRTRPVIQAGNYGSVVGQLQLESDGAGNWTTTKSDLISTKDKDYASPVVDKVKQIVADADEKAKGPGSVVAGTITEDITRATKDGAEDRGAESTLATSSPMRSSQASRTPSSRPPTSASPTRAVCAPTSSAMTSTTRRSAARSRPPNSTRSCRSPTTTES